MSTSTWKGRRPTTANPEEMQIVPLHDQGAERSPLAAARLRRQLTVAEAARRAGIGEDEARWLEEGRVYRFRSTDAAMLALLLYATALGQPPLQLGRHLLRRRGADVAPQRDLEAVAAAAVRARVEVRLGLPHLLVRELAVEVRLHHLLALLARVDAICRHFTTSSASSPFRIRLARWSLLMTVPIGMSRICAVSA